MPGERVTFEIGYEGRRMIARNVRPFGEDKHTQAARGSGRFMPFPLRFAASFPRFVLLLSGFGASPTNFKEILVPQAMVANSHRGRFDRGFDEEDTSRDWNCPTCNERNFLKRNVCFKCQTPKPAVADPGATVIPRRTLSPHAGAREYIREARGSKPEEEEKKEEEEESGSSSP